MPISLLHNQEISGYDLENAKLKQLAAQIFNYEDTNSCITIIEQWLLSRITDVLTSKTTCNLKRIASAIQQLFIMPAISVTELASTVCLSKKQFERLFNELVGANPKEYARNSSFPEIIETATALHRKCKSSSNCISMWLRRPIAFYPGV